MGLEDVVRKTNVDWSNIVATIITALPPNIIGILVYLKTHEIHTTFNSKMDVFIALVEREAYARGKKAEKDKHNGGSN